MLSTSSLRVKADGRSKMVKDPSQTSSLPPKERHTVKIGEASKVLGLHIDTLRRWEKRNKITPVRTPGGTRLYSLGELSSLVPKVLDQISKPPPTKPLPTKNLHRIDEESIYAHVYNKGVEKRIIFNDEEDYKVFIGFLKDYLTAPKSPDSIKKTFKVHNRIFRGTPHQPKNYLNQVELIAYCLMPDHFHLLLHQVTKNSLEKFIRSLCTRYSMYFNKKYKRSGALFEGPYKSVQVKGELQLIHLSRFFHHTGGYCSYQEYLGKRVTPWIKPQVILSQFNRETTYEDFVDKQEPDQKEKELIENITFDSETEHLERRDPARNEEMHPDPDLKPRSRLPQFLAASTTVFVLLVSLGIRNILMVSTPDVLSETKQSPPETSPEATSEAKPKTLVKIAVADKISIVNIRQQPATSSAIVNQAKDGDIFEFVSVSIDSDWFEVKLASGSAGFISATYAEVEKPNN